MYTSFSASPDPADDGQRGFTCHRCRRNFKRAEHLQRHVRTHTKEKPYTCHCGSSFTRKDLLKRHHGIAHSQAENLPDRPPDEKSDRDRRDERDEGSDPSPLSEGNSVHADNGPQASSVAGNNLQQNLPRPLSQHSQQSLEDRLGHSDVTDSSATTGMANVVTPNPLPNAGHTPFPDVSRAGQPAALDMISPNFAASQNLSETPETQFAYLQDITNFMGSMDTLAAASHFGSLDLDNFYTFAEQPEPPQQPHEQEPQEPPAQDLGSHDQADLSDNSNSNNDSYTYHGETQPGSPFRSWLPSAPTSNRDLAAIADYDSPHQAGAFTPFYRVTEERRRHLENSLRDFADILPSHPSYSRHTWTRYLNSFWEGFQQHMPFIHVATTLFHDLAPEEVLAYGSIGAQYRFEPYIAYRLFNAGKALVMERLRRVKQCLNSTEVTASASTSSCRATVFQLMRASIALMVYSAWDTKELVQESMAMRNIVAECFRLLSALDDREDETAPPTLWPAWVVWESRLRARLAAFGYSHLLTIAYNHPPVILCSGLQRLRLPCTPAEWSAQTAADWERERASAGVQLSYQEAMSWVMSSTNDGGKQAKTSQNEPARQPQPTPFGNYTLLQGLLQKIYLVREIAECNDWASSDRSRPYFDEIENALRNWTSLWQANQDSTLNPKDERGPIPFTSSSLLGLAYVRLHLNMGPHRRLETRDPELIARALYALGPLRRDPLLVPALLYAAHSLSIPVRLGVDYVARSQALFWSLGHALSGFDCAVFLAKWLLAVQRTQGAQALSRNETRMLHWVRRIVEEAQVSIGSGEPEQPGGRSTRDVIHQLAPLRLGIETLRIWSRMFQLNVQWPFLNVMGVGLEKYARMLESDGRMTM